MGKIGCIGEDQGSCVGGHGQGPLPLPLPARCQTQPGPSREGRPYLIVLPPLLPPGGRRPLELQLALESLFLCTRILWPGPAQTSVPAQPGTFPASRAKFLDGSWRVLSQHRDRMAPVSPGWWDHSVTMLGKHPETCPRAARAT